MSNHTPDSCPFGRHHPRTLSFSLQAFRSFLRPSYAVWIQCFDINSVTIQNSRTCFMKPVVFQDSYQLLTSGSSRPSIGTRSSHTCFQVEKTIRSYAICVSVPSAERRWNDSDTEPSTARVESQLEMILPLTMAKKFNLLIC